MWTSAITSNKRRALGYGLLPALILLGNLIGCSMPLPDRAERMTHGYVYYFDGAGGGGLIGNWAGGVKQGLLDAGYAGAGEIVHWNTGMGVVPDQDATVEYKRGKAADCAREIRQYARENPGAPITLMGLSAGTAVAVFTLEALPPDCQVDNVVLLGASIAANYDLTRALQRVRGRLYVFTSERDAVLAYMVPMAGTADRQQGVDSAGLRGFQIPLRGSTDTRAQYAKLVHIRWKPEFASAGNLGGHVDTVKAPFVQQYIAPLIMAGMAKQSSTLSMSGKIVNPDFKRWSRFGRGAWVRFEGEQLVDGRPQPARVTARLVSHHEDRLIVERTYETVGGDHSSTPRVHQFLIEAMIDPGEHPLTSPAARTSDLPTESIAIMGKTYTCRGRATRATGTFPEYGSDVDAKVFECDALPGGIAKVQLRSRQGGRPFEFRGQVVAFDTRGS
ncbi:hypothetical protein RAS2_09280 [Phycisphaerae bacterium RAS2]|nr:hypothetical protein RAS2_09280 [Phycisphaerae bacterium RAS2]